MALTRIGETVGEIMLPKLKDPKIQAAIDRALAMSPEQRVQETCRQMNEEGPGEQRAKEDFITCYRCEACNDKTLIHYVSGEQILARNCACIPIRCSIMRARSSGLGDELKRCQFSSFEAITEWQKDAKNRAMQYSHDPQGWFMISGQNGGGKTHLCTAVVGRLIHAGKSARYMRWKDDSAALKGVMNKPEFEDMIQPLLSVDVLYIDDFLKTPRGEDRKPSEPSGGDLNLAFFIINSRYSTGKIVVISSEWTVDDVVSFDEATGSRIYERAKNFCIEIPKGIENNYRLKGAV